MDIKFSKKSIKDNSLIILYWKANEEMGFKLFQSREVARQFSVGKVSEGFNVTSFTKDSVLQPKKRTL